MIRGHDGQRRSERSFPADATSAATARDFVRSTLSEWQREDLADDALLVVSELVTNAALHARTGCVVVVSTRGNEVHLEVADLDPGHLPVPQDPSETDHNGRGLLIVDRIADRWSTEITAGRKVVRCALGGRRPAGA